MQFEERSGVLGVNQRREEMQDQGPRRGLKDSKVGELNEISFGVPHIERVE